MGSKGTRAALEEVAAELGLISSEGYEVSGDKKNSSWWERLIPQKESDEMGVED
jgi:hypothetical protein